MAVDAKASLVYDLGFLDSPYGDAVLEEITESWNAFCFATEEALLNVRKSDHRPSFVLSKFVSHARNLCKYGLASLVEQHFSGLLEETFEKNGASKFWEQFDVYSNVAT